VASITGPRGQLIGESALADPGLASQQEEAATTACRVIKPLKQFPELSLAANKDGSRSLLDHVWTARRSLIGPKDRPAPDIRSMAEGRRSIGLYLRSVPSHALGATALAIECDATKEQKMSQVHKSVVAQPRQVEQQKQRYGAAVAIATGIAAASIAGVLIFSSITSAPPAVQTPQIAEPVDGWMPAAVAAQMARLERMQDGYLPGLLAAHRSELAGASGVRDGWESGLTH
jgi:hypothetical protein